MKRLLKSMFVLLLILSACGQSSEERAVRTAYNELTDNLESGDFDAVFNQMSSNTRTFLDDLASAFEFYGMGWGETGSEFLAGILSGIDMSDLSRNIKSVTFTSATRADVVTATDDGDETMTFVLEDGEWKLDFEDFMKGAIDEGLAGSGITVDDIIAREIQGDLGMGDTVSGTDFEVGSGSSSVRITNDLGSWDIWYVYVSIAGARSEQQRDAEGDLGSALRTARARTGGGLTEEELRMRSAVGSRYNLSEEEWSTVSDIMMMSYAEGISLAQAADRLGVDDQDIRNATATIFGTRGAARGAVIAAGENYDISPSEESQWGQDRLGSSGILSPGNTITVKVAPGTYDIMVTDEDGDTYSRYGVDVGPNGYGWSVTLSDMD